MSEGKKDIERLDEKDTNVLIKQGWNLADLYRSREGGDGSTAYNKAMEKALKSERPVAFVVL